MTNKILIIAAAGLALGLAACAKPDAGANSVTNANSNAASNATAGSPANASVNTNANANANANANKPADNSPKRISFAKGANWGAVNITLAPGASQRFVVGAKSGQTMDVEASSKEVSINLVKGKAETTEDFGFLTAELTSSGDFVFEVKNSTKKEIKTSVKVTIEGAKESEEEPGPDEEEDADKPAAPPKKQ